MPISMIHINVCETFVVKQERQIEEYVPQMIVGFYEYVAVAIVTLVKSVQTMIRPPTVAFIINNGKKNQAF